MFYLVEIFLDHGVLQFTVSSIEDANFEISRFKSAENFRYARIYDVEFDDVDFNCPVSRVIFDSREKFDD